MLTLIIFGLDDIESEYDKDISNYLLILAYIEIFILSVFLIEITFSIKILGCVYFKDIWLIFDFFVIVSSMIFIIIDLSSSNSSFTNTTKVIRAFFRFFRIFILFRKIKKIKIYKKKNEKFDLKAPIEKIMDLLNVLKLMIIEDDELVKEIDWCIDIISSNKLYNPILESLIKDHDRSKEVKNNNYILIY